jgi:nucleoside-diphosphate-sugar epimerase
MSRADHILVIGGTGFIGSHLVQLHLDSGNSVTVVSRTTTDAGSAIRGLEYVRGEAADEPCMRSVIKGASVVYGLAMGGGRTWASFQRDFVDSVRGIAQACTQFRVKRLVYVSSSAALYLGDRRKVDESNGHDPKPETRSYYSRGKIFAERLLMELHARNGLPVTIMRPGIVVGRGGFLTHPGLGNWPSDTWCMPLGKGLHPLPFVLVQDVAQALLSAASAPGIDGLALNLAGDVRPSAAEFVSWCADRSLRRIHFCPTSMAWSWGVLVAKWSVRKLGGAEARFPTYRDLKSNAVHSDIDCSAAKCLLDWRPNADLDYFIHEAIDSHLTPAHPHDLRLNSSPYGALVRCTPLNSKWQT